ncbi:GPI-GlcNAc transferase complex, PIG-H component domain containing protein [Elaphomyces granulatus]
MPAHLTVQHPSPSTVSFSVSNAPTCLTLAAKLAFGIKLATRILLFLFVLFINAAKLCRTSSFAQSKSDALWQDLWSTTVGTLAGRIADTYSWPVVAGLVTVLIYVVFRRGHTEESLLVIRGLGIQTSTSWAMYWSTAATRFIPTTQIQDIVIHEAFQGFEVRFYLAVIVEGEPNAVVVFPSLLPNRRILEEVWRGTRQCLYESKSSPLHN